MDNCALAEIEDKLEEVGIDAIKSLTLEDAPLHELETSLADEERKSDGPPRLDLKRETDMLGSKSVECGPEILCSEHKEPTRPNALPELCWKGIS
jgi:hypothetical protein